MAATKTLHALDGQISDAGHTKSAGDRFITGADCDMTKPVPSLSWSWHSGKRELPQHENLPQNVPVEALCTYAKSKRETAEQTRNGLQRAGFLGLLEDNLHIAATPPAKPPGDFSYQECTPRTLSKFLLSVETPVNSGTGGDQFLPSKKAALEAALMPPPLRRTFTEVPQQASNEMPTLRQPFSTGISPPLSSGKVQMSEDAESGTALAVFSVHENQIVNSTSRQWVSNPFWVKIQGTPVEFRVQCIAKEVAASKKGLSFKKAKGLGKMELKCMGESPKGNRFRVAFLAGPGVKHASLGNNGGTVTTTAATTQGAAGVGDVTTTAASSEAAKRITRRETRCSHDFGKYPTFGLNGNDEFWDFSSLLDKKKRAVFIGIELLPQSHATENESNLEQAQTCSSHVDVPGDSHTICSASTTCSVVDDAEQFQKGQFRLDQLPNATVLGPPLGLALIGRGPPPGLELLRLGPPPGLDLIAPPPDLVA